MPRHPRLPGDGTAFASVSTAACTPEHGGGLQGQTEVIFIDCIISVILPCAFILSIIVIFRIVGDIREIMSYQIRRIFKIVLMIIWTDMLSLCLSQILTAQSSDIT